ncbi:MAG: class I SAM-dependent methyltransferase [Moraxella sp.]|nr:class I SAM-dependent methyltransferase [Moraxella sp.]
MKIIYFEKILKNLKNNAAIADFGCGAGSTLYELHQKNPSYKLYGYDIKQAKNPNDNTPYAYQMLDLDGEFIGVPDACFDFVISQHVLEHLKNPLVYFSELVRTLKVGGFIFLETPSDRSTLLSYPFQQNLNLILSYYDDPTHIGRPWSPQSLYRLGCFHKLDVICSEYDSDWRSKFKLPLSFTRFLIKKDTDKFVDDYWKALGWCSYAVFRKNAHSSHIMDYYSFKNLPHGQLQDI